MATKAGAAESSPDETAASTAATRRFRTESRALLSIKTYM
jgi:hypothetical protein